MAALPNMAGDHHAEADLRLLLLHQRLDGTHDGSLAGPRLLRGAGDEGHEGVPLLGEHSELGVVETGGRHLLGAWRG
eukprot:4553347-Prymnesium_polylepis.1